MTIDRDKALHIFAAALAVLSAGYYALYVDAGFNYSDDGNYAQTAFELFLGRPPQDLDLSYGLLWYEAGAALFHLFGVDFLLVRWLFFGTITLTTLLVFYSLARASGSILTALLLAAVIALVQQDLPKGFPQQVLDSILQGLMKSATQLQGMPAT